jgi:hypothetical protein
MRVSVVIRARADVYISIIVIVETLLSLHRTINRQPSSRQYHHQPLNGILINRHSDRGENERSSPTFIWLALLPEFTGGLDRRFAPVLVQIRVAHDLAADELVLEIRVDDPSRLRRLRSLADGPGSNFIRSAGEIPNQLGPMCEY